MKKWEEFIDYLQSKDFKYITELKNTVGKELGIIKEEPQKKKSNCLVVILSIVGVVTCVAAIAYAVYRFMTPDYLDGFDDDFDDDYEDDFFDDEDEDSDNE